MAGVSAQEQVGDGHDGIVGKGAGSRRIADEESCRITGRERRHVDRAKGRRNMKKIRKEDEMCWC